MKARRTTFLPLLLLISAVFMCFSPTSQAQDTIEVKTGWNIIGSVKAGAVPEVLSTVPDSIITTAFFGYNPGMGYESTDTLGKGLGYWVKVSGDGMIIFNTSSADACGIKRVDHGGISYGTVPIGDQCWLDRNLNVGTMVTGVTNQTNNATTEMYCYNNDPVNCGVYGGLYQWDEAMQYVATPGAQGICPAGWHIPTFSEFQTLSATVGGNGNALKEGGVGAGDGIGTNTSGFSALLAGFRRNDGGFLGLGDYGANFWSSTEYDATYAYGLSLYVVNGNIDLYFYNTKANGFSVRCLED
jgi:uncharacterized protein (TIGR02145 family)